MLHWGNMFGQKWLEVKAYDLTRARGDQRKLHLRFPICENSKAELWGADIRNRRGPVLRDCSNLILKILDSCSVILGGAPGPVLQRKRDCAQPRMMATFPHSFSGLWRKLDPYCECSQQVGCGVSVGGGGVGGWVGGAID